MPAEVFHGLEMENQAEGCDIGEFKTMSIEPSLRDGAYGRWRGMRGG